MFRRLQLARELPAENGIIFVFIDDNEIFNLAPLMSKVFGEKNFIANVIWQKVYSPKNTVMHFSGDHEYVWSIRITGIYCDPIQYLDPKLKTKPIKTRTMTREDRGKQAICPPGIFMVRDLQHHMPIWACHCGTTTG